MSLEKATFGAGCFWGVEENFRVLKGVKQTEVGYGGGDTLDPTYQQVCRGNTGHAEVVHIEFDEEIISYEQLLSVFWKIHNPTTVNRQGFDIGSQYRSVVFYHNEKQKELAELKKEELNSTNVFRSPVVTEITHFIKYYRAEEYHQKYIQKKKNIL